jgi:hypothetical protein
LEFGKRKSPFPNLIDSVAINLTIFSVRFIATQRQSEKLITPEEGKPKSGVIIMKSNGKFNEEIMEFILDSLGLKDLRSEYGIKQLLATADLIRPGRVKNVASKIRNFKSWNDVSAAFLIDRVYGLDYVTEIKGSDQRIAFDFTADPDKIQEKIEKAIEFAPLWKSMGVDKVIILLATYPQGEDQGLAFLDKNEAQEDLLGIVYDAIESDIEVSISTLLIKNNS